MGSSWYAYECAIFYVHTYNRYAMSSRIHSVTDISVGSRSFLVKIIRKLQVHVYPVMANGICCVLFSERL